MSRGFISENLRAEERTSPQSRGESPGKIRIIQDVNHPNGRTYEVFYNPENREVVVYQLSDDGSKIYSFEGNVLENGEMQVSGRRIIPYRDGRPQTCLEDISYYGHEEEPAGYLSIRNNLVLPGDPQVNDTHSVPLVELERRYSAELEVAKFATERAALLSAGEVKVLETGKSRVLAAVSQVG